MHKDFGSLGETLHPAGPQQCYEVLSSHGSCRVWQHCSNPRDSLSLYLPGFSMGENTHGQARHAEETSCFTWPPVWLKNIHHMR